MRFALFFGLFLGVMALMNYYAYRRFFARIHFGFKRVGALLTLALFALEVLFVVETLAHARFAASWSYHLASMAVGITFLLFVTALAYDAMHTVARRIPFDQSRRRFIKIAFDSTMVVLAVSYLLKGVVGGLKAPRIHRVDVALEHFPADGFRIVQLSDVHIGRTLGRDFLRECVRRTNALKPDMVVITGDLVDRPVEELREALEELRALRSEHGTWFVLGNHEYFHGPERIAQHLRTLGVHVLLNEHARIETHAGAFNLVGLNDLVSERIGRMPFDANRAFEGVDTSEPTIVLSHQPKSLARLEAHAFDLMLSGHTHGGQIFPFGLLVMLDQPYLAGLERVDARKQIFISRGTGYWGPPVRVLAPSEISLITLHRV